MPTLSESERRKEGGNSCRNLFLFKTPDSEVWYQMSAQTRDLFCDQSVRCFDRARLARLSARLSEHETLGECEFSSRRH
jgi:hypothetical protein